MRRQLISVATLTAIAQGAGFIKLWLTARLFGVGSVLDGYFLALVVPTFVSGALSGMLQTALFPVRANLASENNTILVERFERTVLTLLLIAGIAIGVLVLLAGPMLLAATSGQVTDSVLEAARFVLPFAAALIPLNAVGDGLGYLLAMRDRYAVAAAAPIANALLGAALLAFWPKGGLLNLVLGTLLGLALQVGICAWGLSRANFCFLGRLDFSSHFRQELREMLRLGGWIFPGVVFANLSATLPTVLIAPYGEGAVSAFGYAWRLHQYAIQLLVMASSPILLARFSQLVTAGDEAMVQELLRKALWLSVALGLVATATVAMTGEPLLEMVFGERFGAEAAKHVAGHWLFLTLALGPVLLGNIYAKVWQARGLARFMSFLAGLGLVTVVGVHTVLSPWLGASSVAVAVVVASLVIPIVGWRAAWPKPGNLNARFNEQHNFSEKV